MRRADYAAFVVDNFRRMDDSNSPHVFALESLTAMISTLTTKINNIEQKFSETKTPLSIDKFIMVSKPGFTLGDTQQNQQLQL